MGLNIRNAYGRWTSDLLLRKQRSDMKRPCTMIDNRLLYMITIEFKRTLPSAGQARIVEQCYQSICDRMFLQSELNRGKRIQRKPFMIAFLDKLGSRSRQALNGFDHYHCLLVLHPATQTNFETNFLRRLIKKGKDYYDNYHGVMHVKQVHITAYDPERTSVPALAGYCSKLQAIEQYTSFSYNKYEMFCLPKASERRAYPFYRNIDVRKMAL